MKNMNRVGPNLIDYFQVTSCQGLGNHLVSISSSFSEILSPSGIQALSNFIFGNPVLGYVVFINFDFPHASILYPLHHHRHGVASS